MYVLFHHVAERLVNHLMSLQGALACKLRRNNGNGKMPATTFGAFVASVLAAVIAHLDSQWREGLAQAVLDQRRAFAAGEVLFKLHGVCICIGIGMIVHSGGRERLAALTFTAESCETV